ncbi:Flp pilus assembly protein CpaB [Caulobacter flavus]|uniref:Flp pilus assembly protein CpaB n=1 Tax=Caulobacter flavus TaxID=1679497 RepID=A0A2N5CRF5_9CAUL|nr:Flp pilus assembly protein CpaB [Caulobacter flavus]AYV46170.1 Flp pilus assembly protein CpaB [Caulobacter flavus]PLR11541.1 Flp pilus assembly protein CpaB [Caulobacter flavus]
MNPVRIIIVLVAAVSAIGLAVLMQKAMGGKSARSEAVASAPTAPSLDAKPMTLVLVAKRDLAIGTRLTKDDVDWKAWPADAVSPVYITNGAAPVEPATGAAKVVKTATDAAGVLGGAPPEAAVEGAIVRDPLLAGEPIVPRKIVRGGEGGYLSVVLSPGARAMAVPVTSETAAGGFILPGDRVDVLMSRDASNADTSGGKQVIAETVLQNIRVLALDQATAAEKDAKTIVAATATLEVRPGEAEALTRAKASGPVTLALRAYTDLGGPSGVAAAPTQDSTVIRINRGGQTSSISVRQ